METNSGTQGVKCSQWEVCSERETPAATGRMERNWGGGCVVGWGLEKDMKQK